MEDSSRIAETIKELAESLALSSSGEAYRMLERIDHCRVGIAATSVDGVPQFSIELVLEVFTPSSIIDVSKLERAVMIVKALAESGYMISHEDDGWLRCEMVSVATGIVREYERLRVLLN